MKLKRSQVVSLVGYCAVGAVCGSLVFNTLAVPVRGSTDHYVLEFTDVEGLNVGNPVTLSSVRVGRVDAVDVADTDGGAALARVTVEIEVHGDKVIKHIIDGETVLEYEQAQLDERDAHAKELAEKAGTKMLKEGTISLQSESHPIDFRKVELLVLPGEPGSL